MDLGFLETRGLSDHQVQLVHSALQVKLVQEESLAYLVYQDQTGLLEIQGSMEKLERREIKDLKDIRGQSDFRVLEVSKEIRAREVYTEKLV